MLSWLPTSLATALMGDRSSRPEGVEELARRMFRDTEAARSVGERALVLHPVDADPTPLVAALSRVTDPMLFRATLLRRRREELGRGESLIVDGWVLARSEAQLCVLAARDASARS